MYKFVRNNELWGNEQAHNGLVRIFVAFHALTYPRNNTPLTYPHNNTPLTYPRNNTPLTYLVSFPDDFSLSGGKIRLVICLFHFGSGAPKCWRIVLF